MNYVRVNKLLKASGLTNETLIALRNAINAELEVRLAVLEREYLSFKEQVKP